MTLEHDTEKRFHSDIGLYIADPRSLDALASMRRSARNTFCSRFRASGKNGSHLMCACCVKASTFSLRDNKDVISEKASGRFQSLHLGDLRTIDGVLSLRLLFFRMRVEGTDTRVCFRWLCCGPDSVFDEVASLPVLVRACPL